LPEPPRKLRRARVFFSFLFTLLFLIGAGWAAWLAIAPASAPAAPQWHIPYLTDQLAKWDLAQIVIPVILAVISLLLLLLSLAIFARQLRKVRDERSRDYGEGLRAAAA